MSQVTTRLLSLIMLMQRQRTWKAGDLAAELGVSERTVHRYLSNLDEMGIPIYSERGPYGGFGLLRGYRLPPMVFSAEEATVLYMGAQLVSELWGQTYHDAVTGATAKLDNVLPDELRQEVARQRRNLHVGGLTALDYRPWGPTIHLLRRCIAERRCVHLTYHGLRQEETERCVEPYALTLQWGMFYLVARCQLRQALRTFRVDRISAATAGEGRYTIPADFDLHAYLRRSMSTEERALTIRVALEPALVQMVREQHGHWMALSEGEDGGAVAQFQAARLEWATGWVLSLGAQTRVLEPAELAEAVRQAAEGILARYAVVECGGLPPL
jgi:predicted DNA-binding transcriptional regulator YafY